MKNTLKKIGAIATLSIMMTVSLAGCTKKTTCEFCQQEKKCYHVQAVESGKKYQGYLCNDCYDTFKSLAKLSNAKVKKLIF